MHANNAAFVLRSLDKKRFATFAPVFGLFLALSLITSCSRDSQPPSNEQLQQKAAQATETVKRDSKEALANARVAAAKAEGQVNAIASGVKQGIHGDAGAATPDPGSRIDLNTASESDLAALPGISNEKARQIISHRPYSSAHQLVGRGLLSQSQFARIAADVTVR
jgi:DNA uptake protein ComE-like DNA-binding protein